MINVALIPIEEKEKEHIKAYFSSNILSLISDTAVQNIIRHIVFNSDTVIDWQEVVKIIAVNMPEVLLDEEFQKKFRRWDI